MPQHKQKNYNGKCNGVHPYFEFLEEYCIDIENRIVYLIGEVDLDTVHSIVKQLKYLTTEKYLGDRAKEPIILVINSPGGFDDMMLHLYDAITLCSSPVITVGMGMVCSAASLILVSGDERYCSPLCLFMTHKGRAEISGDDDELQAQAELNKKLSQTYWKLLGRHTKHTAQWWYDHSKVEGEFWLDANDMLKNGVVDGIILPERRILDPLSTRAIKTRVSHDNELEDDEDSES